MTRHVHAAAAIPGLSAPYCSCVVGNPWQTHAPNWPCEFAAADSPKRLWKALINNGF